MSAAGTTCVASAVHRSVQSRFAANANATSCSQNISARLHPQEKYSRRTTAHLDDEAMWFDGNGAVAKTGRAKRVGRERHVEPRAQQRLERFHHQPKQLLRDRTHTTRHQHNRRHRIGDRTRKKNETSSSHHRAVAAAHRHLNLCIVATPSAFPEFRTPPSEPILDGTTRARNEWANVSSAASPRPARGRVRAHIALRSASTSRPQ
jgi:hypothetical protein